MLSLLDYLHVWWDLCFLSRSDRVCSPYWIIYTYGEICISYLDQTVYALPIGLSTRMVWSIMKTTAGVVETQSVFTHKAYMNSTRLRDQPYTCTRTQYDEESQSCSTWARIWITVADQGDWQSMTVGINSIMYMSKNTPWWRVSSQSQAGFIYWRPIYL